MRTKLALLALTSALAACATPQNADTSARGLAPVNAPVVTRADYALDVAAPEGSLSPSEANRLDAWFAGLGLGYGDSIYVDGAYGDAARADVARVAGRYGLLVSAGAPVTASAVAPGTVRVIVSRTRASVPGCPNWSKAALPNFDNEQMSNFGCGVNSNIAAMIADPQDLVYGREGTGVGDAASTSKAIRAYRSTAPSGAGGLQAVSTKGN